jgi:LysM repeat protein
MKRDPKNIMHLTHEQARELVQKGLETRLDAVESAAVAAHIEACAECAAFAADAHMLDQRLAQSLAARWPERWYAEAALQDKLASMQSRIRRDRMVRNISAFARLSGVIVGLILLLGGLAWLVQRATLQPLDGISGWGAPSPTPEGCVYTEYQVQEGDTLGALAQRFDVSVESIMKQNRLEEDLILSNQVLEIPVCMPAQAATETPAARERKKSEPVTYTVKAGDTCRSIASQFQISVEELRILNGLPANCSTLFVGQVLRVGNGRPNGAEKISVDEAAVLVRAWIMDNNAGMDPDALFPLREFSLDQDFNTGARDELWQRMGAQVYKITGGVMQYETFLIKDRQVWELGSGFGGSGVSSMVVTDLDANGWPELVYTYSFGSGIHQSSLGMATEGSGEMEIVEASDIRFPGDLRLERQDDQTLVLKQFLDAQSLEGAAMGRVRLVGGRLLLDQNFMP